MVSCSPMAGWHWGHSETWVRKVLQPFYASSGRVGVPGTLKLLVWVHLGPVKAGEQRSAMLNKAEPRMELVLLPYTATFSLREAKAHVGYVFSFYVVSQMEYERQVASVRAQNALEGDFSISQAELSSRQAMLENASDIKVNCCSIYWLCFIYQPPTLTKDLKETGVW